MIRQKLSSLEFKDSLEIDYQGYRKFYLKSDITQSRIALLLLVMPLLGFVFNDYLFFGFSDTFLVLAAIRSSIVLIISYAIFYIGKVKTYPSYDRIIFLATLSLIVGGAMINATRPENYLFHSIFAIVSVFVLYLVVPLRLILQIPIASLMTIGEAILILFFSNNKDSPVMFTLFFSMFVANVIAAMSSWQLHSYRHRVYQEFTQRRKLQDSLQDQTNHLAELVEERNKELVESQARLLKSERLAAIGEMAGMIGHDLRNPLSGIKNACYYLRKKQGNFVGDKGLEMLCIIDRSVQYADKIVNDLLDYSREIRLTRENCSPKAIINYIILSSKVPKGVKILGHVEDNVSLHIDETKIQRVFTNLINNAFDAMPNGGTLEIASHQKGKDFLIIFSDTGTGMTSETIEQIFTPLFTTKAQGMGFGLPICKRIVEAHGGTITVASTIGKGTSFTITLPVQ
jgi:signal transduction histidine kinase